MENVKGILSSKVQGNNVFDNILSDLQNPSAAFPQYKDSGVGSYRIYSLVKSTDSIRGESLAPEDFIVECEKYGIPQARHRVILFAGKNRDTLLNAEK